MLSTDRTIFEKGSSAFNRMVDYSGLFDELHVLVLNAGEKHKIKVSDKLFIYGTGSKNKIRMFFDAISLGKKMKGIDVVSAQDPFEVGYVGMKIAKKIKAKLHLQIHTDFMSPYFTYVHKFKNIIRRKIAKKVLPKADGIRVVSERIKRSLDQFKLKIIPVVLPIFVDPDKLHGHPSNFDIHKKYPQFSSILLMITRLESEKDFESAFQALKRVHVIFPNTGLVIVGDGSLREALKMRVKELKIEHHVCFEGQHADIQAYIKTADIYLQTSLYEGYGMTFIEVATLRLPIVSTRVGIMGDVFTHGKSAMICPPQDVGCLARSISALIDDNDKAYQMYMEALRNVNEHCISKDSYLEHYKNSLYIK